MSQQPAPASPGGVEIVISGHVEGENIAIGPGAAVNVVKNYFQAKLSDTQQHRLAAEIKAEVLAQIGLLGNAGFRAEVAPLPGRAERVSVGDPFALPVGVSPLPGRIAPADAQRWQQQIAPLDQRLRQLDQQLSAAAPGERRVARELMVGQERVNLVELLLQQGNLAVWSFRQLAARLFADQVSAYYLAHPAWPDLPPIHAFHDAALNNLEVRRGWVLYQKYRIHRPEMTGPHLAELGQGRWRDVLQAWLAAKQITGEAFQYERAYLKAIGERYDPEAVRNAARQAEACFSEALRRQPDNSIALVNWGAIKAERALFFSIESGVVDQARLQGAQALFNRAEGQLEQRRDRDGQIALGLCLYHDATRLPPDANLASVEWAAQRAQQMRQEFPQASQEAIQWEMVQRNWARRDARFFDEQKAHRAKQILVAAGAAALLYLLEEKLTAHAQMLQQVERWGKAVGTLSRRTFLLRAGIGVGAVAVAGGAAAVAGATIFSNHPTTTPTARPTATFTPTPAPGSLLTTHRYGDRVNSLSWEMSGGTASFKSLAQGVPHPASSRIASASQDGTVDVWEASTGKTLARYIGHQGPVLALAWSPDGTRIASGGMDSLVQIWDPGSGKTIATYRSHDGAVSALAWSPDGQRLASADIFGVLQVTFFNDQRPYTAKNPGLNSIFALAWSPDGSALAGGGGVNLIGLVGGDGTGALGATQGESGLAAIWDASTGEPVLTYSGHSQPVRAVAWSPDSKLVVSGSDDSMAQVWDRTSGKVQVSYKNHNGPVYALAWAQKKPYIVSGSGDFTAQVWSASDGSPILPPYRGHEGAVRTVGWSPDEQAIASGSDDKTVQVWVAPS